MGIEQARVNFEIAYAEKLNSDHPGASVTANEVKASRNGDEYAGQLASSAWWAWQASRESLVIELPVRDSDPTPGEGWARDAAIEACAEAIEAAGLKVKQG